MAPASAWPGPSMHGGGGGLFAQALKAHTTAGLAVAIALKYFLGRGILY